MATRERRTTTRKGMCMNEECEKAKSKEIQTVRAGKDFVCSAEGCGQELREIRGGGGGGDNTMVIVIIGIAVAVIGLGAGSYFTKFPAALYGGGEKVVVVDPVVDEEPEVTEPEVVEEPKVVDPKPVNPTTLTLPYGKYTGAIKNYKANGQGKMTYTTRTLISPYDREQRYANAGQYVIGTWYDNKLDNGTLYDASGTVIDVLTIGRAE